MKLTHDITLLIEWNGNAFDVFNPGSDNGIGGPVSSENPGREARLEGKRFRAYATLHLPLNGKEKPFLTVDPMIQHRDPALEGWDK